MSQVYYKATRPNGTDFYSGMIAYAVGATVKPAPGVVKPRICGPGYLHAADVPSETLIGGSWPCRLFEVTGEPQAGFNGEHLHKGAFLELYVEREIEAWRALGPNGREIVAFIERCRALGASDFDALKKWDAAWDAARDAATDAAWAATDAAWAAARAALAICARDLITPEQFNILYKPFALVIPVDSLSLKRDVA